MYEPANFKARIAAIAFDEKWIEILKLSNLQLIFTALNPNPPPQPTSKPSPQPSN